MVYEINAIQRFFVCCICRWETTKTRRKNARILKKGQVRMMKTFKKNFRQNAHILKSRVSVSKFKSQVSSRNFNQISVSKITVSTTSLVRSVISLHRWSWNQSVGVDSCGSLLSCCSRTLRIGPGAKATFLTSAIFLTCYCLSVILLLKAKE